jgi:hypothetical protein
VIGDNSSKFNGRRLICHGKCPLSGTSHAFDLLDYLILKMQRHQQITERLLDCRVLSIALKPPGCDAGVIGDTGGKQRRNASPRNGLRFVGNAGRGPGNCLSFFGTHHDATAQIVFTATSSIVVLLLPEPHSSPGWGAQIGPGSTCAHSNGVDARFIAERNRLDLGQS